MRALAVMAVVVVATLAAAAALLVVALPRPGRGDLAVVQAARVLGRYRYVTSDISLGRRTVDAWCYHGWFRVPGRGVVHGTLVRVGRRGWVRFLPPRGLRAGGGVSLPPLDALELAGCPSELAPRLAAYALSHSVGARTLRLDGRSVLALRVHRLTLLVLRRTGVPVGVELDGRRSAIQLTPFTRRLRVRLEVPA